MSSSRSSALGGYSPFSFTIHVRDASFATRRALSMYDRSEAGVTEGHEFLHFVLETTTAFGILSWIGYLETCMEVHSLLEEASAIDLPLNATSLRGSHWVRCWLQTRGDTVIEASLAQILLAERAGSIEILGLGTVLQHAAWGVTETGDRVLIGDRVVQESLIRQVEQVLVQELADSCPVAGGDYEVLETYGRLVAEQERLAFRLPASDLATLAERALQSFSPGYFALAYIAEFLRDPAGGADVAAGRVDAKHGHSPDRFLQRCASAIEDALGLLAKAAPHNRYLPWILKRLRTGLEIRRERPRLVADLVTASDPWVALQELTLKHCVPAAIDRESRFVAIEPLDGAPDDFPSDCARFAHGLVHALGVTLSADQETSTRCEFERNCDLAFKDEACASRPWVRAAQSPTCATGAAYRFLGFHGQPVSRQTS